MSWLRRRRRTTAPATPPAPPIEEERMITTADEIVRAEQAADLATLHLETAITRRDEVDAQVRLISQVNEDNGFADLIRKAFGS